MQQGAGPAACAVPSLSSSWRAADQLGEYSRETEAKSSLSTGTSALVILGRKVVAGQSGHRDSS